MKLRLVPVFFAALLAGCGGTGPIYPVVAWLHEWVKAPDALVAGSDQAPVIASPVVTFRLDRGQRLSALQARGEWGGVEWRIGKTYLFGFDVRLDRRSLGNARVALSRLYRAGDPATEIVSVDLDAGRGVTVLGRGCIAPSDLADWHRVEMRIKLSDDDTGYLEVFCDRKPIWARTEIRTTFPPVCRRREGCDTVVAKPVRFNLQMGLMSDEGVANAVVVQMQRLHYRPLLYKPHRVGTL